MRITIKSLEQKIQALENEKTRYYNLWQQVKDELEQNAERKIMQRNIEEDSCRREVGNLMQIIHILAKDPTLTMPTMNTDEFRHR